MEAHCMRAVPGYSMWIELKTDFSREYLLHKKKAGA